MSGYQSRVRDYINQAAPGFATVSIEDRGLSAFLDPMMTGRTRFMQKAGAPFPLLTPQLSATLTTAASAGASSATIDGTRLGKWLRPGMVISFELLEQVTIEAFNPDTGGITFSPPLSAGHTAGVTVRVDAFAISAGENTTEGDGSITSPAVPFNSPFVLVPGDIITISGKGYNIATAELTSVVGDVLTYAVQVTASSGLPALSPSTSVLVTAAPVYQSELLALPHTLPHSLIQGPLALDFVSSPMVAEYIPSPESRLFIEPFNASQQPLSLPQEVEKNHVLAQVQLGRDQVLFWRTVEGSMNLNATYPEIIASDSGRSHFWTPCRPAIESSPTFTKAAVVASFSPYLVSLADRVLDGSVVVVDALTKATIPDTDYSVNYDSGAVSFDAAYAGALVYITYRPRHEWQVLVIPSEDDIEMCVVLGQEPKQLFLLGAAGAPHTVLIKATADNPIDQIHVTFRRADDSAGSFKVEMGDWHPRGGIVSYIRYTISTGADRDYDWASSGLILKPLWPTIEILRARLDGESLFSRYLDNGRLLL